MTFLESELPLGPSFLAVLEYDKVEEILVVGSRGEPAGFLVFFGSGASRLKSKKK